MQVNGVGNPLTVRRLQPHSRDYLRGRRKESMVDEIKMPQSDICLKHLSQTYMLREKQLDLYIFIPFQLANSQTLALFTVVSKEPDSFSKIGAVMRV